MTREHGTGHPGPDDGGRRHLAIALGLILAFMAAEVVVAFLARSLALLADAGHMLTDAAGFIATAAAAVVIITTGFSRADAIASLLVVALMARAAWDLLGASGRILLEGTPDGADLESVRAQLLAASPHVTAVHDLHAWTVTSGFPAVSAHVVVDGSCFSDGHAPQILDALQATLIGQFDIEHSTLQLELPAHAGHEKGAH